MHRNTRSAIRRSIGLAAVVCGVLGVSVALAETTDQSTSVVDQDGNISIVSDGQSVVLQNGQVTITSPSGAVSSALATPVSVACPTAVPTPADGSESSVSVSSNGTTVSVVDGQVTIANPDGTCLALGQLVVGETSATSTPVPTQTPVATSTPAATGLAPGLDLSGASLAGRDLRGQDGVGATLVGADLSQAQLSGARLVGANLSGAKLAGADFSNASLVGANFQGADLRGAKLTGASVTGATFTGAHLEGADLRGARGLSSDQLAGAITDSSTLR